MKRLADGEDGGGFSWEREWDGNKKLHLQLRRSKVKVVKKFKPGVVFEGRTYYSRIANLYDHYKHSASKIESLVVGNLHDPVNFSLEPGAEYKWDIRRKDIFENGRIITVFFSKLIKLDDREAAIQKAEKAAMQEAKAREKIAEEEEKRVLEKEGRFKVDILMHQGPGGSRDWSEMEMVLVNGRWISWRAYKGYKY